MKAYQIVAKMLNSGASLTAEAISMHTGVDAPHGVIKNLRNKGLPISTSRVGRMAHYTLDRNLMATNDLVLSRLLAGQELTADLIAGTFGVSNPYSVIKQLKERGHDIQKGKVYNSIGRKVSCWMM